MALSNTSVYCEYSNHVSSLEEREREYAGIWSNPLVPKLTVDFAAPIDTGVTCPVARFGANVFSLLLEYATGGAMGADPQRYWNGLARFSHVARQVLQPFARAVCTRPEHWARASAYKTESIGFLRALTARVAAQFCPSLICQFFKTAVFDSFDLLSLQKGKALSLGDWVLCHLNVHDALFVPFQATGVLRLSFGPSSESRDSTALCRAYYDTALERRKASLAPSKRPELSLETLAAALESLYPLPVPCDNDADQCIGDLLQLAFVPVERHRSGEPSLPRKTVIDPTAMTTAPRSTRRSSRRLKSLSLSNSSEQDSEYTADEDSDTVDQEDDEWGCKSERRRIKSPRAQRRKRMASSLDEGVAYTLPAAKRAKVAQTVANEPEYEPEVASIAQSQSSPLYKRVKVLFFPVVSL